MTNEDNDDDDDDDENLESQTNRFSIAISYSLLLNIRKSAIYI